MTVEIHLTDAEIPAPEGSAGAVGREARIGAILHGRKGAGKTSFVEANRRGLPVSTVECIEKHLALSDKAALELIGISKRALDRRKAERKPLDLIQSDRAYRLARLVAHAEEAFEEQAVALDWLKSPNRALGDAPIEFLDTDAGTEQVEAVLSRIEHGVYS